MEHPTPPSRPLLTQVEAAAACGVSRSTIRRARETGRLPGATRHPARGWLIPVDALLAAGFRLHAPAPPDTPGKPPSASPANGSATVGHQVGHDRPHPAHPPGNTPVADPATRPDARPEPATPGHPLLISPASGPATVGHPATPGHDQDNAAVEAARLHTELAAARAEADRLRAELARADSHLADLQRVVRALTPAPERPALTADSAGAGHEPEPAPPTPPSEVGAEAPARPRLWNRLRRRGA